MRRMTEEQAELYIKAGYFPKATETEAIDDLQDVFGHMDYWAIVRWLYNADTRVNAEKLFRLIWHKDEVESFMKESKWIHELEKERVDLEAQMSLINQKLDKVQKELFSIKNKMSGNTDYYSEIG